VVGRITADHEQGPSFELAVKKKSAGESRVAGRAAYSCEKVAMLVLERSSALARVRTATLPNWSRAMSLSPDENGCRQQMLCRADVGTISPNTNRTEREAGAPKQAGQRAKLTPAGTRMPFATERESVRLVTQSAFMLPVTLRMVEYYGRL